MLGKFILLLVLFFSTMPVYALTDKTDKDKKVLKATLLTTETDEYKTLRNEGFELLYNMNYKAAIERFDKMKLLIPDHPAGYFHLAACYWLSMLNSSRRLQTGIYNNNSFYAESKERVDERSDKEFRVLIEAAIEKSEVAVKKNPSDPYALYYQGASHGLLASYEGTISRAFISALRNGSKSVDLHKKVVEIEPNLLDAYLTIGTYDYIVGSLPLFVKMLATIGGFRGSKERGLQELEMVAEKGNFARDDAKVLLIALYNRESRYQDAVKLLETLSAKYPKNYLFKLEMASCLVKLDRAEESFKIFENVLSDESMKTIADLAGFQYAEALASQHRYIDAAKRFQKVIDQEGANSDLVTRAHLQAGQMFDLSLRRLDAISHYQKVLQRDNVFDCHEQAQKYLKKPYIRD
ncbi:MAG: DUF3808 domain-containing protein [Blastocatellia bacterium]|nr:DUF3808 domain-containing protein [Blastocatellia bacterium]